MPRENASKAEILQPRKRLQPLKAPKHIRAKNFLAELDDVLGSIGVEECSILIQKGKKHFKGRTKDGKLSMLSCGIAAPDFKNRHCLFVRFFQ